MLIVVEEDGAFVVFELYETNEGGEYVKFVLNAHPSEKDNKPVEKMQFEPTETKLLFEVREMAVLTYVFSLLTRWDLL